MSLFHHISAFAIAAIAVPTVTLCACANSADATKAEQSDNSISAIYLGIKGYGIDDKTADKDSFEFRFYAVEERIMTFAPDSGEYTLQNLLMEGYRMIIVPSDDTPSQIAELQLATPIASGCVTAISSDSIFINNKGFALAPDALFTDITTAAGGATATAINTVSLGNSVKIYGNPVSHVDCVFVSSPYEPLVAPTAGERTLRNFLRTALTPMGVTLYVYGGAWNWQDDAAANQARRIGIPTEWLDFFQSHNADYNYKDATPSQSYYPWHKYNEYHYAGADCSGYVGWTIYNTLHDVDGKPGYVMPSLTMASRLANDYHLGTFSKEKSRGSFRPGDIVSMKGHVYIILGECSDGSLLIAHSTVNGGQGSGIQLSAVSDDPDCEAMALARQYMKRFDEWSNRYQPALKDPYLYLDFSPTLAGRFSWTLNNESNENSADSGNLLSDPDGLSTMTVPEIMQAIFP